MGHYDDEVTARPALPADLSPGRVVTVPARGADDAVDDARATAPDRSITGTVTGEPVVLGDAHGLRQVLGTLVRNALVHTSAGSPIELSAARAGREVRVEVRDHGPGLPTGEADPLSERFWRAEGGRERGKGGAGLGPAIVAGMMGAHGGSVLAADAPGGGAVFTVVLPGAAGAGEGDGAVSPRSASA